MAKKEFKYRGKSLEELQAMTHKEVAALMPTRSRRSVHRGLSDEHKIVLKKCAAGDKNLKTHRRNLVIFPEMVGATIKVHNGKEFVDVAIQPEMIGHRLGEFAPSRKSIAHSSPGVGATKSSASASVR